MEECKYNQTYYSTRHYVSCPAEIAQGIHQI